MRTRVIGEQDDMNRGKAGFLALAAIAVLTVGCAPSPTATTAPPSADPPVASPSPSASPTESEAPAADPSDPSTWLITETGVGPIEIGGDLSATLAELPQPWTNDTASCSWSAWWNSEDADFGMYFVRGPEDPASPISEISVYTAAEAPAPSSSPLTSDGLGLGASRAEVMASHPDATEGAAEIGGGTWLMLPGDGAAHVFFEFREGSDVASDVVVTTRTSPSYEVCG